MASIRTGLAQTALRETRRTPYVCPQCEIRQMKLSPFNDLPRRRQIRYSSTDTAPPPLLAKIKGDLKDAMRAKDTPRLNVLRAMISEYNNASKTNTPIKTDTQLLAVLKKKRVASEAAAAEAKAANRSDLEDKNVQEIKVIDEYASEVKLVPEDEIRNIVSTVIESFNKATATSEAKVGDVLKELLKVGGRLSGRPVDNAQVLKIVNELLASGRK